MNLVDVLFILFIGFYSYRGFHRGFVREGLDLMGFGLGIAAALRLYPLFAKPLIFIGIGAAPAKVAAGILIFVAFVAAAGLLAARVERIFGNHLRSKPLKVSGAAFASSWSTLFAVFLMIVVTVIPSPRGVQSQVRDSFVGGTVLTSDSRVYPLLEDYAKNDARNLLFYVRQFFTQLDPQPTTRSDGGEDEYFEIQASNDIALDLGAEKAILDLVNKERAERGLGVLKAHEPIRRVARSHSADMYQRGYFAHNNPDGKDPFDRMAVGGVTFSFAGENLALAPTITLVHQGLMNSPKHKANILKPEFTDLGIGIYKGPYGLMVTQNFCAGC
ncbi:MAG: CvpA family protein [Actinomycetota bacterium]